MNIEVKYNIGYQFWAPRVKKLYETESIIMNGIKYSRDSFILKEYAKLKRISNIDIRITKSGTEISYYCLDVDPTNKLNILPTRCYEEDMQFLTEEGALKFALDWKETKQTEYYGYKEEPL